MRKQGITFGFFNNPVDGDKITVNASINGLDIIFNNGQNVIDIAFKDTVVDVFHDVKIGTDVNESANNLKLFFENNGYFTSSFEINYILTIGEIPFLDMYFKTEDIIFFIDSATNTNVSVTFFNDVITESVRLKYFFQYKNIVSDDYRCNIYQRGYIGNPIEISGKATMTKGEIKDHLNPLRGSGVSLVLEANENMTFEDFYVERETDFSIKLYRNNAILFVGFLKPDGIFQSYTRDIWNINIECVDGIGFLSNLSFVNSNGLRFHGKMSALDIIYNCLNRTGLQLEINTFVDVYYYGIIDEDQFTDVLAQSYLSTDRFIKSDDNTIMSCEEVLTSVLGIFNAVVTQRYGQWFIFRPNDLYNNEYPIAKRYNVNNEFLYLTNFLSRLEIGSQIDNKYPYHCNSNQQITIKGAISAFRLGYKYGFISSFLNNGNLTHEAGTKIYEGWDVQTWTESEATGFLIIDPVSTTGINFKSAVSYPGHPFTRTTALISNEIVDLLQDYSFEFKTKFKSYGFPASILFSISLTPADGSADYTMNGDGTWTLSNIGFRLYNSDSFPNNTGELVDDAYERSFSIQSQPIPKAGYITIYIEVPLKGTFNDPTPVKVEVKSIEAINTFQGNNIVGEFHTVSRSEHVSSIIKENKTIGNGDSPSNFYTGAIYMNNQTDLTSLWHRGIFPNLTATEQKPILRIVSEDNLRIGQKPTKLFSGDTFGYSDYLSLIRINKIDGKFMPIAWSFDTYTNITNMKLLQLYAPELSSMEYSRTDDFGETIKPTITS